MCLCVVMLFMIYLCRDHRDDLSDVLNEVGLTVFQAFTDYENGDYSDVVKKMYPIKNKIYKLGNSNAQVISSYFA